MEKFIFSKGERRFIIILMIINSLALFVNYFELRGQIKNCTRVFTNSGEYTINNKDYFFPFVNEFTDKKDCFIGIFPYYDTSEFFVYTILIFGLVIVKKIW